MRLAPLFLAAFIAIVVAVAVFKFSGDKNAQAPGEGKQPSSSFSSVSTVDVLVAKTGIAAGTVIDETMVDKQPWPAHLVAESFIVDGSQESKVVGMVARANFQPREPLLASKLANPGDPSFIAGTLPPGMRAVTLGVDAVSGVAGYALPGDRVDILITHNIPEEQATQQGVRTVSPYSAKPGVTEVLIPNALVLAVNVRPTSVKDPNPTNVPSNITVQVPDQGAQEIRLAEKVGTLSVALRAVADKNSDERPAPTDTPMLTRVSVLEGEPVRIVHGTGKSTVTTDTVRGSASPYAVPAMPANP